MHEAGSNELPICAVMVPVADLASGLAWYQAAFPRAKRVRVSAPRGTIELLMLDGVELTIVPEDAKLPAGATGTVVYWRVTSLAEALTRLEALGATRHRGPMEIGRGIGMCQVRDPWGNCIGLRGPYPLRSAE